MRPVLASLIAVCGACDPDPVRPEPEPAPCDVDPTGLVCTIAGTGFREAGPDDAPALSTGLNLPTSLTVTPAGPPLLTDFNNHRIRLFEADGTLTTLAGNGVHAYALDGAIARETGLENPIASVMGDDGAVFIQELHGARILRIDPETGVITTYAGSAENPGYPGYAGDGGPALEASLSEGGGLSLGDDGTLYIADTGNHCIRKVTPDGTIDTVGGNGIQGLADGVGTVAQFGGPQDVAWFDGWLYVSEGANNAVRRIDLATGEVTTIAGDGTRGYAGDGGPAIDAQLAEPRGVGVGPDGAVYVADSGNHVIRRIDPADGTITTVVGAPGEDGSVDQVPPDEARLNWPNDVAVADNGDVYVVDTLNDVVRRIASGE